MLAIGAALRRASAVLLLVLTACGHAPGPRDLPLDPVRRSLALDAVNRLGDALNRGACQSIYDEASTVFQQLESSAAWRDGCERMRASLGTWKSFSARAAFATGTSAVLVDGTVVFAKGRCHLGTTWRLENGRARLFSLYLLGPGGPMTIPEPWPDRQKRWDPPPPKPPVAAA
jgi:hypothetical protein